MDQERHPMIAWQEEWPEDAPLSEAELREELEGVRAELRAIARRMQALHKRLPEPAYFDMIFDDNEEVPETIYFELVSTVAGISDELSGVDDTIRYGLEATAESLRAAWVQRVASRRPGPY